MRLTIPEDYSLEKTGITQSLLGQWMTCPRRFLLAVNRWSNVRKMSKTTSIGTMFHGFLDDWYSSRISQTDTAVEKSIRTAGKNIEGLDSVDRELFGATAFALAKGYLGYYKDKDKKFEEVERTFEVDIDGFKLRGKKDGVFKDKTGKRWIMEHKTKSRINEEALTARLSIDLQNLLYLYADSKEHPADPAVGVLYNVIRVPDIKKFTEPAQIVPYIDGLIKKDPEYYFLRFEISYTRKQVSDFQKQITMILHQLSNSIHFGDEISFWRNPTACDLPYTCPFLDACSTGSLSGYTQRERLFMELDEA
jgi:hypothetical protein